MMGNNKITPGGLVSFWKMAWKTECMLGVMFAFDFLVEVRNFA
jgi:hypothetical protein